MSTAERTTTAARLLPVLLAAFVAGCGSAEEAASTSAALGAPIPLAGRGYDLVADEPKADCVEYDAQASAPGAEGDETEVHYRFVRSSSELARTMDIGFEASAAAFLGEAPANGKAASAEHTTFDGVSEYALVSIRDRRAPKHLEGARLTPAARALLTSTGGAARFRESCGDAFIESVVVGGEFLGIARFETTEATDRTALRAAIAAKFGAVVDARTQSVAGTDGGVSNASVDYYVSGDEGAARCLTLDCMLERAASFRSAPSLGGVAVDLGWDPLESTCRHASLSIL